MEADTLPPELAAITAEAEQLESESGTGPNGSPDEPAAPVVEINYSKDARGLVNIAAESMGAFYPSTGPILADEARARIAGALAPVMQKHNWTLGALFGKWGEEIQLGFVLAQLAIPIAKAIRADRAAVPAEAAPKREGRTVPEVAEAFTPAAAASPGADLYTRV